MKNLKLAMAVQLCSAILARVAVDLNGGQSLPKLKGDPLSALTQSQQQARTRGPGTASGCAIMGCGNPNRTKGYCAAHYQKLRMLEKTNRRPASWKDYAQVGSVADLLLPRGRAGSKALAVHNARRNQATA